MSDIKLSNIITASLCYCSQGLIVPDFLQFQIAFTSCWIHIYGTFTIFYTVNHPTNAPETTLALKNGSLLTFWFCFGHMFLWNIDTNFYIVMYARCNPRSNSTARTLINNLSRCSASNSSARSVMVKMTESNLEYNSMLMFVCLVGFLTSSSTTRLYRGWAPRQSVWQFNMLPYMRQS